MVWISSRDDCGNGKRCDGVTGRKASISSYVGSRRAFVLKPGIGQVSGNRKMAWLEPCDALQNVRQYLAIEHRFTSEQRRVLHLRVFADQPMAYSEAGAAPMPIAAMGDIPRTAVS